MSIPKQYYEIPTQVLFGELDYLDDTDEYRVRPLGGIAYHDYVICMECGQVIPLDYIDYRLGFKELSWISVSDEVLGDEYFDEDWESIEGQEFLKNLDRDIQESDSNSHKIADHEIYVRAAFVNYIQDEGNPHYNHGRGTVFYYKFPDNYSDYMIEKEVQWNYVNWAKEIYSDVVPDALISRFCKVLEEEGPSKEDYSWEKISKEEYDFHSKK